jgi:hypothetical protein
MHLDKDLYRQAYQQYQQWNEIEARERIRQAGQLSAAGAWHRYVDLVEFCWLLSPKPSQHQRREKLIALDRYYTRVQKLEVWRSKRGKAT